jgi:formylglycine-generating enzyme required for sulfatase activity
MLVLLSVIGLMIRGRVVEQNRATHAAGLVQRLLDADPAQVPAIIAEMDDYRTWADPLLRQEYEQAAPNSRQKLYAALALLPVDAGQRDYLFDRLLSATPQQVPVIVQALKPHGLALEDGLWRVAEKPAGDLQPLRILVGEAERLRAACALAAFDPDSPRWQGIAAAVVEQLVAENPVHLGQWLVSLRPVKGRLLAPLGVVFRDKPKGSSERNLATILLAAYAADRPDTLADLLMDADERQFAVIYPKLKERGEQGLRMLTAEIDKKLPPDLPSSDEGREKLAKRQANAAVALLRMNQPEKVWNLLKYNPKDNPDPRVRSYLIHRLGPMGAEVGSLVKKEEEAETDLTIRRALLLSLGPEEFGEQTWRPEQKKRLVGRLQELYRTADDPGLHAAAEWLLRQWHQEEWLAQTDKTWAGDRKWREKRQEDIRRVLRQKKAEAKPQWYVTGQGQTMVVLPGPVGFRMGSPATEKGRYDSEKQHRKRISRSFAIAAKPVTLKQYLTYYRQRFGQEYDYLKNVAPNEDCPVHGTTWYQAAGYCNWLSEQEGIEKEQWCYETDEKGRVTKLKKNYLSLTGYRLPTEAEWEYACRAGSVTSRYYGESEELLPKYAWYLTNANNRTWPVGSKKPNDLGLFDIQGNVFSWCQERYRSYPQGEKIEEDKEDILSINSQDNRMLRGGSFNLHASYERSADRNLNVPAYRLSNNGFRPARTLP